MRTESFGPWATALSPVRGAKLSTFWARRLTMLTNLGRSSPILSRRVRYGLIAMAMVALVMPSLRGTPAALPGGDDNDHPRS
jgi:hypothetical protein